MSWNPVTSLILKKDNAMVNFAKKKKRREKSNVLFKIHINQRCVLKKNSEKFTYIFTKIIDDMYIGSVW